MEIYTSIIRHHPSLKQSVFASIKTTMEKIYTLGKDYTPTDDIKQWYILSPVVPSAPSNEGDAPASMDVDVEMQPGEASASQAESSLPTSNAPAPGPEPTSPYLDDSTPKTHENTIVSYVDVLCKVIESLSRSVSSAAHTHLSSWRASSNTLPIAESLLLIKRLWTAWAS